MGVAESMRQDWDARARKQAFFYIASWRKDWDVPSFFASGDEDYQRLVAPVLDRFRFGLGQEDAGTRLRRRANDVGLRPHFGQVVAADVSAQMLDQARRLLPDTKNVTWKKANGANLSDIPNESFDFAFSYLVLQHLPEEDLVRAYVHELLRVLRPSGICLFQFNGMKRPTMNWKGTLAWGVVDTLWSIRLRKVSRFAASSLGFDPEMAGKTWHGAPVTIERVVEVVRASGGTILEVSGDGTPMAWCCARKA